MLDHVYIVIEVASSYAVMNQLTTLKRLLMRLNSGMGGRPINIAYNPLDWEAEKLSSLIVNLW